MNHPPDHTRCVFFCLALCALLISGCDDQKQAERIYEEDAPRDVSHDLTQPDTSEMSRDSEETLDTSEVTDSFEPLDISVEPMMCVATLPNIFREDADFVDSDGDGYLEGIGSERVRFTHWSSYLGCGNGGTWTMSREESFARAASDPFNGELDTTKACAEFSFTTGLPEGLYSVGGQDAFAGLCVSLDLAEALADQGLCVYRWGDYQRC